MLTFNSLNNQTRLLKVAIKWGQSVAPHYSCIYVCVLSPLSRWPDPAVWEASKHLQHLWTSPPWKSQEACNCDNRPASSLEHGHPQEWGMTEEIPFWSEHVTPFLKSSLVFFNSHGMKEIRKKLKALFQVAQKLTFLRQVSFSFS